MVKFKSQYPNRLYHGCRFNENCEFSTGNEKIINTLRGSRLMKENDIWEVADEPSNTGNADSGEGLTVNEEVRLKELLAKGSHTTPAEKKELKELKEQLGN